MSMFPEPAYRHGVYRTTKMWRERLGRYRLMGSRCRKCGALWWPRRIGGVCGKCNSRDLEPYEFSHEGVLKTHSLSSGTPLMGMEVYGADRRIVASVLLDEGVVVGPTEIVDTTFENLKDGVKVQMVTRKLRRESNGNWMYGYMWVPVRE